MRTKTFFKEKLLKCIAYCILNINICLIIYFCRSGLGCATVIDPAGAALQAAHILALTDHVIWSKIRARQLSTWVGLKVADKTTRDDK